MSRVLVSGAAGFIGLNLSRRLAEDGKRRVVLVENFMRGRKDAEFEELLRRPNVELVEADLTRPEALLLLNGRFDEVYHLAAMVGVKHCMDRPAEVLKVNIVATMNLADRVFSEGCGRFFFASTSEIYAGALEHGLMPVPTPETVPIVVTDPANPRWSYAVSKLAGEQYVRFAAAKAGVPLVIGRFHNVYGPRMGFAHVIPEVVKRALAGETPFKVYGAEQTRAFCHVDDAVGGVLAAMSGKTAPGLYHIGTDRETAILELVGIILKRLGKNTELLSVPAPLGSVARRSPDIAKLRAASGFVPTIPLEEGLPSVIDWYADALKNGEAWE